MGCQCCYSPTCLLHAQPIHCNPSSQATPLTHMGIGLLSLTWYNTSPPVSTPLNPAKAQATSAHGLVVSFTVGCSPPVSTPTGLHPRHPV